MVVMGMQITQGLKLCSKYGSLSYQPTHRTRLCTKAVLTHTLIIRPPGHKYLLTSQSYDTLDIEHFHAVPRKLYNQDSTVLAFNLFKRLAVIAAAELRSTKLARNIAEAIGQNAHTQSISFWQRWRLQNLSCFSASVTLSKCLWLNECIFTAIQVFQTKPITKLT